MIGDTSPEATPQPVGVDLERSRRPGVPRLRAPEPWPNTRFPPPPQLSRPSVPKHGRPNKRMPPVFGTAVPLRGVSGLVRVAAYRVPDHQLRHWLLLLLADRVDVWEHRVGRLLMLVAPAAAVALLLKGGLAAARR